MSDKFGASHVSLVSPDPKKTYPIVLGKSFFQRQSRSRPTGFVSATYRFKPSSIDQSKPGHISFENTSATLQFERRTNPQSTNSGKQTAVKFRGESKVASDREFFLWFDASEQRMVLERSGIQIKQLKHDRDAGNARSINYNDTSKDRMKQMDEKHKKKARLKGKGGGGTKKRNATKITIKSKAHTPNPMAMNSDTSSTRSSSQSISPSHHVIASSSDPNHSIQRTANHLNHNPQNYNNTQFRNSKGGGHSTEQQTVYWNHGSSSHNPVTAHSNVNPMHKSSFANDEFSNTEHNANGPTPLFGWQDESDSDDDDMFVE